MNSDSVRLRSIFDQPGWARFTAQLRGYRDTGRPLPAAVTLPEPTEEERRRHAALLRLTVPRRAGRLRYDLCAISAALQTAGLPGDWDTVLEIVFGPIPASTLAARAAQQAWQSLWANARAGLLDTDFPCRQEWLAALHRDGTLKRLSDGNATAAATLLDQANRLLAALPFPVDQPLAHTAAHHCGDSHALDPDRPLSTLVLRGLALRTGQRPPTRAPDRRDLWSQFGVVCDELSAPVLTFNLGLTGDAPLTALIAQASAAVQPLHLTTRLLWATPWIRISCPPRVFVCENPTIVAVASARLGADCAPLLCIDGELKTAARVLLRALRDHDVALHYHGDFDWPGIGIAARVIGEFSADPWRFGEADYVTASRSPGRALVGAHQPTPWSPGLGPIMSKTKRAYDEELLVDPLIEDLAVQNSRPRATK